MVSFQDVQTAYYMVAATGVLVAAVYYIYNMRTSQKAMKTNLETRQFQLLMQLSDNAMTKEGYRNYLEFINMQWSDYDDFERKFGSDNNPDNYAVRESTASWFKRAGILLRYGMIDRELLYDFLGNSSIGLWNRYKDVVNVQRKIYDIPELWKDWEYLYGEMVKVGSKRGINADHREDARYTGEIRGRVVHGSQ